MSGKKKIFQPSFPSKAAIRDLITQIELVGLQVRKPVKIKTRSSSVTVTATHQKGWHIGSCAGPLSSHPAADSLGGTYLAKDLYKENVLSHLQGRHFSDERARLNSPPKLATMRNNAPRGTTPPGNAPQQWATHDTLKLSLRNV